MFSDEEEEIVFKSSVEIKVSFQLNPIIQLITFAQYSIAAFFFVTGFISHRDLKVFALKKIYKKKKDILN